MSVFVFEQKLNFQIFDFFFQVVYVSDFSGQMACFEVLRKVDIKFRVIFYYTCVIWRSNLHNFPKNDQKEVKATLKTWNS